MRSGSDDILLKVSTFQAEFKTSFIITHHHTRGAPTWVKWSQEMSNNLWTIFINK